MFGCVLCHEAIDVWEEACELDREVNCVDVYRLCTERCS